MRVHYQCFLYLVDLLSYLLPNHPSFSLFKWISIVKIIAFRDLEEENRCKHNNCFFKGKNTPFCLEYFVLVLSVVYKY